MTNEQLIARQALRIEELSDARGALVEAANVSIMHMVCVGGPLNDNKLGYSREQLAPFFAIKQLLEDGLGGDAEGLEGEPR